MESLTVRNNKRLAKNTGFLYIRMLLIMVVQFFTIRITLQYLGVEDYGIYNVVCGVTNIFTFLTHTMTSASQRFLSYDLGIGEVIRTKTTFDTLVVIFLCAAIVGIIILGAVGYWLIENKLVIPPERINAALVAFYFTLLHLLLSVFTIPYNSLIIAHEDMKLFAFVSVLDAGLKLLVVYLLVVIPFDKLKTYSSLNLVAYLVPTFVYLFYCYKNYPEVSNKLTIDWKLFRKIVPFMSWNLLGGLSWMLCTQGMSILTNLFFGPIANAAKGIADRVNTAINGFTSNFMMAAQPQIVKSYAINDMEGMKKTFYLTSNISFFMMLVIAVPIIISADGILGLWLKEHDELTTRMTQLVILFSMIGVLENPINQAIRATGNIKNYQVYIALITFLVIPVAYMFFRLGFPAYFGFVAMIIVYGIAFFARLYYLKKQIGISYTMYCKNVLIKCSVCFALTVVAENLLSVLLNHSVNVIYFWLTCVLISLIVVYFVGMSSNERQYVKTLIMNRIKKK